MTPENANVFLSEDDKTWKGIVKRRLERAGHKVVFEASDLDTALSGAKQADDLNVDVAVVDGNLNERDISCEDGRLVAKTLRETSPDIKIIALSGSDLADYGDVRLDKGKRDEVSKLPDLVREI